MERFSTLRMIDANTGWALAGKTVLQTSDGGMHWKDVTSSRASLTPDSVMDALTPSQAWVAIPQSNYAVTRIFRTTDGGQSWTETAPGSSFKRVTQLDFVSSAEGWAVSGQGKGAQFLLKTEDGGQTWTPVTSTLS